MSIMNLCLKWSPIIPENQVNRSLFCVASPHLSKTGEGALQILQGRETLFKDGTLFILIGKSFYIQVT